MVRTATRRLINVQKRSIRYSTLLRVATVERGTKPIVRPPCQLCVYELSRKAIAPMVDSHLRMWHKPLPILRSKTSLKMSEKGKGKGKKCVGVKNSLDHSRSEEHTSELQSRGHLVCRLLLE